MRIIIALDSFKESMSATVAVASAAAGIRAAHPAVTCLEAPISDGGEGLLDVLIPVLGLETISVEVLDAYGELRTASYGLNPATGMAVIEVAQAIGLEHVPPHRRRILQASSAGVGQLLKDAHERGARDFLIGLGGTATSDGGIGAFLELGGSVMTSAGSADAFDARALQEISSINLPDLSSWANTTVTLACDVSNPLTGATGAAQVFAPQKGASPEEVQLLDLLLGRWGQLVEDATGVQVVHAAGAGAAGGLGAFFLGFFGAMFKPGIDIVLDAIGLDDLLPSADLVITGEGKIDAQTCHGKAPWGVLQRARVQRVPVIAVCGKREDGVEHLVGDAAFLDIVPISDPSVSLPQSLKEGPERIAQTCAQIVSRWMDRACGAGGHWHTLQQATQEGIRKQPQEEELP